ncbi:ventricular zone-expressed PH domain-containing protein-like [Aplochiton taeniatus]
MMTYNLNALGCYCVQEKAVIVYCTAPDTDEEETPNRTPIHRHLGHLTALIPKLQSAEQQHLLRLIQMVAEQHPLMLSPQVPALVGHLGDPGLSETLLSALVDVSLASPSSLVSFLAALRSLGQRCPALLGRVAKVHGAVGVLSERQARGSLAYLVSLLGSMEHSLHHSLLLEIRALTDRHPSILAGGSKDIYRMSNSFTAIARLLGRGLELEGALHSRVEEDSACPPSPSVSEPGTGSCVGGSEQQLQVKIQAFEEKMGEEGGEGEMEGESPAPQRRYSLGQAAREERRQMRFNRSKSLALHAVRSRSVTSITSNNGEDGEGSELSPETLPPATAANLPPDHQEVPSSETGLTNESSALALTALDGGRREGEKGEEGRSEEDRLFVHLRDNMEMIKAFCNEMVRQIPIPEQCVIEESSRGCLAKLSFSCPLKGHYCLYAKSCFSLASRQPHLWIHAMLLHLQSKSSVPLSSEDVCVQRLGSLWDRTQLKGAHSFPVAMTKHTTPHKKDLDSLQIHLEEVRFFDLFGYSEEEGGWLCFMCNNPEKATEPLGNHSKVRFDLSGRSDRFACCEPGGAQPLIEGKAEGEAGSLEDLDSLQIHLEEVRFFDLFGYSEEEGGWLCFMCNNPEKATVVNQEGQPLIEGKLKEKQVRWKFIKRWKTRYFTLAGSQLLFRKGKTKDELDDIPIELSKVQSVKVVAKKRRERGLPRAFEIFTDSKTYVLKAPDEKHAEEWLQCINVAVAQARERENREATTYL